MVPVISSAEIEAIIIFFILIKLFVLNMGIEKGT
jgi:hypothetical protein